MIFGRKEYREKLEKTVFEIAQKLDITVIYAGVVGSISRGISTFDSDYDVKCLFVKNRNTTPPPVL